MNALIVTLAMLGADPGGDGTLPLAAHNGNNNDECAKLAEEVKQLKKMIAHLKEKHHHPKPPKKCCPPHPHPHTTCAPPMPYPPPCPPPTTCAPLRRHHPMTTCAPLRRLIFCRPMRLGHCY